MTREKNKKKSRVSSTYGVYVSGNPRGIDDALASVPTFHVLPLSLGRAVVPDCRLFCAHVIGRKRRVRASSGWAQATNSFALVGWAETTLLRFYSPIGRQPAPALEWAEKPLCFFFSCLDRTQSLCASDWAEAACSRLALVGHKPACLGF